MNCMITRNNYETFFLLYLDNELSAADRAAVEQFITQNPDLREYWESLQQTVIIPESAVVFPFKADLFKDEKERRRPWLLTALSTPLRITAAALIAGAILLLLLFPHRTSTTAPSIAGKPSPAVPAVVTAPAIDPAIMHPSATLRPSAIANSLSVKNNPVAAVTSQPVTTSNKKKKHIVPLQNNSLAQAPGEAEKQIEKVQIQGTVAPLQVAPSIFAGTLNNTAADFRMIHNDVTSPVEDDLSDEAAPGKKNKLRGLFRKVSRVLNKTASRDDDEHRSILIGGFQFALK